MDSANRIHYECTRCGNCCRWEGIVRLQEDEIDRISEFLGMTPQTFVEAYTRLAPHRRGLALIDNEKGHCIMLTEDGLCRIHPVKPEQCRGFPNVWRTPDWRKHCQARPVASP